MSCDPPPSAAQEGYVHGQSEPSEIHLNGVSIDGDHYIPVTCSTGKINLLQFKS